ncbi:MAG TPA: ATP-binding protein [Candidatus Dependentiae bacterium]|nr:ATP-binding protein [Candidatus Dependentiae bacterium]HRQ62523.1 ATP-binding protein [Candidatus Dependentiae bacterium]
MLQKKFFIWLTLVLCLPAHTVPSDAQNNQNQLPRHVDVSAPSSKSKRKTRLKPYHNPNPDNNNQIPGKQENAAPVPPQKPMPDWLIRASIKNAPPLLKGIVFYLGSLPDCALVPSFHRLILVGPPGTGKTTLARSLAHMLGYSSVYIAASQLLGKYRNETAVNIRNFFNTFTKDHTKKIIIIDELHKLFEHYAQEKTDHSENAAAFWLELDRLEKNNPNIIVIGTANDASKLPAEIKSRFHGKIITMPLPDKQQKIEAFKNIINHDDSVMFDDSIDDTFITSIITRWHDCSLRDVQLLVDTAKMFKYAEIGFSYNYHVTLSRIHFDLALMQLRSETENFSESFADKIYPTVKKWGLFVSVALNCIALAKIMSKVVGNVQPHMAHA